MTGHQSRWFSIMGALLLVIASVAGAATVTVSADHDLNEEQEAFCDKQEGSLIGWITNTPDYCEPHDTEVNATGDAEQTKIDLYSGGSSVHDASEVTLTSLQNYASDSEEIALMVGKQAAIDAYMNGSTQIQAEQAARDAVEDYYSQRQRSIADSWNTSVNYWDYMEEVAGNETGVQNSQQAGDGSGYLAPVTNTDEPQEFRGTSTGTETLANGTTITVVALDYWGNSATGEDPTSSSVSLTTGKVAQNGYDDVSSEAVYGAEIRASTISGGDYSDLTYLDFVEYKEDWNALNSKSSAVGDEMVTFVNNTYDHWDENDLNESDLVDPYLGARNYAPEEDFQAWALSSYSAAGYDSPVNLSTFGSMEILDHEANEIVDGILMSKDLPANDTFRAGEMYDAAALDGAQYVVTDSGKHEIAGEFTVEEMTDSDGTNRTEVVYRNVTYDTPDKESYKELQTELAELRATIEAWSDTGAGGGGGLLDGNEDALIGIIALVGVVLLAQGRNGGDN